ncbi:Condensin-2 complex subunit D3 [Harpegnathos saltator]|uniref:Condensin-2 complex subunit D3 n=2 Tax=Harpegnathos saltator TaxID=610380 RepID=E2BBY8_HARSA|nr:Condensin-2 complex subunit D3 [Harpegnathos saltator]
MESLRIFHNFKLDTLDEFWIKSVWDAEFLHYEEPPDDYLEYLESDDMRLLLRKCRHILKKWITTNCNNPLDCESSNFSWENLMILNINVQGLLPVLDYIMKTGQRVSTDEASKQACLEATSLYLMLLTIPGSNAFRIYHPNLYERTMDTLKMSDCIFSSRKKKTKEMDTVINSSIDDESSVYEILSHSEKLTLVEGINRIISDLITMLKLFKLKERTGSLGLTIQRLLQITRLEMHDISYSHAKNMDYRVSSLSKNAFEALQELCNSDHGAISLTIMLIAQSMLPYLLFPHYTNSYETKIVIRKKLLMTMHKAAIYFLKDLLKIHKEEARQGIITLIHQLMVNCPERAEGRQRQADIVVKLLNICNKSIIENVLKDLILYSYNGKISYRLFAQEIIGKLLIEPTLLHKALHEDKRMKMRKILITVVMSRCKDRSPMVRGRAMATLALISDCNDDADKAILENIFKDTVTDKRFFVIDDLQTVIRKNVNPLPGSDTLITMLLDRVNDERAFVRRSVLKILRNLSVMLPSLVDRMTPVISERCRDPTLVVRQFAVHVLSEMLEQFPHNPKLLHEWTQAVMPQIFDVENKVQEKVLECLYNVLIKKITSALVYKPSNANNLPWRVLDKLSNIRMRKHLSKACSLWVKNGVITKSVISNVQSHIGTDNTIGAWILLAALVENMKILSIRRHIADYKDVICKNDFHASLVLHVLRHVWSYLDRKCLEDLHQYIFERACHFEISFNLISICLDIFSSVLRHLHANKNNNCVEEAVAKLMILSEAKVQNMLKEKEDDAQGMIRAIFTLGHASLLCTNKISSSTLWFLRKLLLNSESLPKSVNNIKGLQTSAVVLLCQQALRDREIAKKITPILGELICRETSPDSSAEIAVKINAAKALADICVRFTALVEPYLPDMCVSMKDPSPAVREAIVVIFIQLLLEDFIKIKGSFFFHILTMLLDTDNMIRELTIFLIEERLLKKNKMLISQQFLESIYYYNNYNVPSTFCGYRMCDTKKKILTMPGKANRDKRNVVYKFMLDHLDPPAKFQLVVKLTKYILCEICDGNSIDLEKEEGACVLRDTICILCNDRLQVSSFAEKNKFEILDESTELDETNLSQPSTSTSTNNNNATNVFVTAMKKYHLDSLLPTLITLKKRFNASKSRLESEVEKLLYKIYSDHDKDNLLILLDEYPELEKDMERYRKMKDTTTHSESDSDTCDSSSPMTPTTSHRDLLLDACKRTPARALNSLSPSPSRIPTNTNDRLDSNNDSPNLSYSKFIKNVSVRLERIPLTGLSSGLSLSTSTPRLIQHSNPGTSYSSTCIVRIKRPSSELGMSSSSVRKISKSSVSRL